MTAVDVASTHRRILAAQRATYVAFIGSGVAFASWASRIPQVRNSLGLSPAALGLVLLAIAAGSIVALPLAGTIVHRFASGRTVAAMSALLGVALVVVAVGYLLGVLPVVGGLAIFGFANGAWDVAMNVQGAAVERALGRSIMSRFHAGYSVGTVAGAVLGAAMVAGHVPVTAHLLVIAVVVGTVVPLAVRRFLPDVAANVTADVGVEADPAEVAPAQVAARVDPDADAAPRAGASARHGALARWREPRTVLIGIFVLAFAFTEGAGNDWISVALIDGYQVPAVVGTLGLAAFLTAMTGARWFGPGLLDRYGRVIVVRVLALLAVVGVALFTFGAVSPVAFLGVLLWGAGASLGFPVGMSAAADDPAAAPGRVSVVGSIGYCAFLGGPPLIGFLGDRFTVLHALLAVGGLLTVSLLVAGSLRPLRQQ